MGAIAVWFAGVAWTSADQTRALTGAIFVLFTVLALVTYLFWNRFPHDLRTATSEISLSIAGWFLAWAGLGIAVISRGGPTSLFLGLSIVAISYLYLLVRLGYATSRIQFWRRGA